ncbi:MAG: hypothetical protein LBE20_03610 [Deltaproteobacteria bacterium]|jgi:P4 family phage/plasmid primase-like protien|nr:hypothetical protein [Deltaproteobacteria bacterium]
MSKKLDFDNININALNRLPTLLREWLPEGVQQGNEYVCGSWNGEKGTSLSININTGKGGDFASNDLVGDPIGIYAKRFNIDRVQAARELDKIVNNTPEVISKPKKVDSEVEKIKKLNKILSESVSLLKTPAQKYLQNRGLTSCNTNIFKYRPHKSGGGSLVCIAFNENNEVKAVQQVFITAEGKKNTIVKNIKITNGFPSGNPIRIPRRPSVSENTPIIVCEGPEDAITLSNATGFEVWGTCGLSFMDKIPFIPERQYLIVRDNDPIGSEADVKINKIISTLIDRGLNNLLCTRPPDGVKDSNELLKTTGIKAVEEMINNAQPVHDFRNLTEEDTQKSQALENEVCENNEVNKFLTKEGLKIKNCSKYEYNDTGNSERIVEHWGDKVKYIDELSWAIYKKGRWELASDKRALNMVMDVIKKIKKERNYITEIRKEALEKWYWKSRSEHCTRASLNLAKAKLLIEAEKFNQYPYYLNCNNGVLDLKTGKLLPHNPEYYLTKKIDTNYDPSAKCPQWDKFLNEIFSGNIDLINYIQRCVGYSLTGDTCEQCMFIFLGHGSDGKSLFFDVLKNLLRDYHCNIPVSTFELKKQENEAQPFIAQLQNIRFVVSAESNTDVYFNEALIKSLTGEREIVTRGLYSAPINMKIEFKIWLSTNYKLKLKNTERGIKRRLKLIPLNEYFYEDGDNSEEAKKGRLKDKKLYEKLSTEKEGILAWAIRGCLEWQKLGGLHEVDIVKDTTENYFKEMDTIGNFLEECCEKNPCYSIEARDLYQSYRKWCEKTGHIAFADNGFYRKLSEKNIERRHTRCGNRYFGIVLKNWNNNFVN